MEWKLMALCGKQQFGMEIKILLLLLLFFIKSCNSFPEDPKPNLVISTKDSSTLPVFTGGTSGHDKALLDIQEVKIIDDKILLGCRNSVYVIPVASFLEGKYVVSYSQVLNWTSSRKTQEDCMKKISSIRRCQNYIRVVARMSTNSVLLCGTNAAEPECRRYEWSKSELPHFGKFASGGGSFKVPYDDTASLAYLHSNGYIFSATTIAINSRPSISRTDVTIEDPVSLHNVTEASRLKTLRTDERAQPTKLKRPHFVAAFDSPGRVYVFFREEALESSDATEKVVYSRVARVCKNDQGGTRNLLNGRWTSFFKARINCFVPGDPPFHFNEIQHVTEPVIRNGTMFIYATMTTPKNSIAGSAVCAFTMDEIERAMIGPHKEQDQSTGCWKQRVESGIDPPLHTCSNDTQRLEVETLSFIRKHSFMSEPVQPLHGKPLFMLAQSKTRFTAIAVEGSVIGANGAEVTVLYIGTDDGRLLMVTTNQAPSSGNLSTTFSEEWKVYQKKVCSRNDVTAGDDDPTYPDRGVMSEQQRVRNVTLLSNSDVVLVTFQHCVISVPKKACHHHKCKSSCVHSGNPYCGWHGGSCVPLDPNKRPHIQQDLFGEEPTTESCSNEDDFPPSCTNGIAYPLSLGLVSAFTLILLLYLLITKWKGNTWSVKECSSCLRTDACNGYTEGKKTMKSGHRGRNGDPSRVTIEAAASIEPMIDNRPDIMTSPSGKNSNENSNHGTRDALVGQDLSQENQNFEETIWSEDDVEPDRPASDHQLAVKILPYRLLVGDATEKLQSNHNNSNNNKTIQNSHTMKNGRNKVSFLPMPDGRPRAQTAPQNVIKHYGATRNTEKAENVSKDLFQEEASLDYAPYLCMQAIIGTVSQRGAKQRSRDAKPFYPDDENLLIVKGERIGEDFNSGQMLSSLSRRTPASRREYVKIESLSPLLASFKGCLDHPEKNKHSQMESRYNCEEEALSSLPSVKKEIYREHLSPSASKDTSRSNCTSLEGIGENQKDEEKTNFSMQKIIPCVNTLTAFSKNEQIGLEQEKMQDVVENIYDEVCEDFPTCPDGNDSS